MVLNTGTVCGHGPMDEELLVSKQQNLIIQGDKVATFGGSEPYFVWRCSLLSLNLLRGMFAEADQLVFKYWELSGCRGPHGSLICGFWHPRRSTLGVFRKGEAHNCISCGKLQGNLGFLFPRPTLFSEANCYSHSTSKVDLKVFVLLLVSVCLFLVLRHLH